MLSRFLRSWFLYVVFLSVLFLALFDIEFHQDKLSQFKEFTKKLSTEPDRTFLFAGRVAAMDFFLLPPGWSFCELLGQEQCLGV